MTIQEAAKVAYDCQYAVNLSAVVHTFSQVLSEGLWPEALRQNKGTDWVNQHPITTVFLDKLMSLNRGIYDTMLVQTHFRIVRELSQGVSHGTESAETTRP
jgi:hypothetical protein